ncbi:PDGLE domain-containing protein [Candidatus Oleimmundimicrobium sp.]|uniref:PDGLE domain-containing protein n=1 Tax=Candidatus Oleimmundimicrobium sp. TaxID=3060597 RepID=UPI0027194477|nr:PDGLE domain-containing protein [Candidatus Oleimmundimicrobium sp.]MDO8885673.1 PDGLE domain-containing protein [Candidatus Oleimmundimicrobium sp.]
MKKFVLIALITSFVLAILLSPFASSWPDGLEKVAEDKGFLSRTEGAEIWEKSPIPDYTMPGFGEGAVATGAAGLVGTAITFALGYGLAKLLMKKETIKA